MKYYSLFLTLILFLFSCGEKYPDGWVDVERLLKNDAENWLTLGGTYLEQHHSPLNQINAKNVHQLGFAWETDVRSPIGRVPRGMEATPIVVDGIMYTSAPWGYVYAIDAKTGEQIWKFDPEVDASYAKKACCDVVNRGVAVWKGKVYVGSLDGYLICLDAQSGALLWRKDTFTDRSRGYTITGPPKVAGSIVMIGNSGAENGVRGYITAYDLDSGELKWRFYTVPGDPENGFEHEELEMASKTWDPNSYWEVGGGGTSWGESAYDPELNLLYVGTGNANPYPHWIRSPSGGDNLFLASILAINPDSGKLIWHYQTTPGESWDYTATMNIILADLELEGKPRKVLMQAPKNGFFYVLDRATGELISAEKYTRANWASHIDIETGRPVLTRNGKWYKDEPKLVYPGLNGGHNWQPMSFNPVSSLVYIPEHNLPMVYNALKDYKWEPYNHNTGLDHSLLRDFQSVSDQVDWERDTVYTESLLAWNPKTQEAAWKIPYGAPDGGILSTPELVFQGTRTGYLKVYDAKSGRKLKEIFTGTGIMAAPCSYSIDGEQYIAVMAGYGGAPVGFYQDDAITWKYQNYGRILSFKLKGKKTPLPAKTKQTPVPEPPDMVPDQTLVDIGSSLYWKHCVACHGMFGGYHRSQHPDLAKMEKSTYGLFSEIVLGGILGKNGMASFAQSLSQEDVEAIKHYLLNEQQKIYVMSNE